MRLIKLFALLFCFSSTVFSQDPYTQTQFSYDSIIDVDYGTAIDYAGNSVALKMDIFKPLNNNCQRPAIILVHGGDWVAGSKEEMINMSRELAKKGWVVGAINYRLGTHKASNYTMYALCNTSLSAPCGYISDSSEVYRANYRGMQDAKGAIRFLKGRNELDSIDVNNVFIAGESAGGFVSMATAFTDQLSEKHVSCFAIADAPTPDVDLATYGCVPAPLSLSRPDLGSIDGTLNLGTFDATVKGVGNFYGGLLDLNIVPQITDTPSVYLFHQGSDVIVNYNYGKLLGRISWECFAQTNICQTYFFYPYAYGSKGIENYFISLGALSPVYQSEIIENFTYLNNCFSNGHSIDNLYLRIQNMANLFATKIALSGNVPTTICSASLVNSDLTAQLRLFPNPSSEFVSIQYGGNVEAEEIQVLNSQGQIIYSSKINFATINTSMFKNGVYFITLITPKSKIVQKYVKE